MLVAFIHFVLCNQHKQGTGRADIMNCAGIPSSPNLSWGEHKTSSNVDRKTAVWGIVMLEPALKVFVVGVLSQAVSMAIAGSDHSTLGTSGCSS